MIESALPVELKARKGENIFLIPEGNVVKRGVALADQIIIDKLTKCGDVKATCEGVGSFYIDGEYDNYNNGYLPFLSMQDAFDYIEAKEFLSQIKYMDLSHLEIDDVKAIKAIVFTHKEPILGLQSAVDSLQEPDKSTSPKIG